MIRIAERFEVSGSYLARICTLLNVPRPERGYWAKLAVGKAPPQRPLPEARAGDPLQWSRDGEPIAAPKPVAPIPRAPRAKALKIPRGMIHALVRGARTHFENGRPIDEGAYLKPFKRLLVDVTASAACLDTALELASDLFNALESVGHRVVLAPAGAQLHRQEVEEREAGGAPRERWHYSGLWAPCRPTVVYIGSVAVGLSVVEMSEHVTLRYVRGKYIRERDHVPSRRDGHTWTTTRDVPSGRLRIIAYCPYGRVTWSQQWQDTPKASLRPALKTIVAAIEQAASDLVAKLEAAERRAEIEHREWLAKQERWRREEDRRRVEQANSDSDKQLRDVIRQWSDIMSVEAFLAGVQTRAEVLSGDEKAMVLERLALARGFLGSQDPLDFFREWKTPDERYESRYTEEEDDLR
ncbi:MAG: hypothetical protein KF730_03330 [Sphingomonas sp.]|uniref:hypothetical protein n=1 Tax=Sphingomonas sp. TaxID=28214 RepID=UPI0025E41C6A|nr:hypothetical protein [Sphingomonas sp.]MBX3563590.1 hypothetical protein [Sphingomonas sp.]